MNKIAGTLLCFDRYDYTKLVVESLENCVEADDIDWYVFQDGVKSPLSEIEYTTQEKLDKVKTIFENSSLNIIEFKQSDWNMSIPFQKHQAHKVFEMGYETAFFFEDDMVVSKYYLRLLKIMAKQFPNDIGFLFNTTNSNNLHRLTSCGAARLWGYYMNQVLYEKIKPTYEHYIKQVTQIDYNSHWLFTEKKKSLDLPFGRPHDITLTRLSKSKGARKFVPVTTRATYIGRKGNLAYRTDRTWFKKGMNRQPKRIEYPEDATLESFRLT